MPKEGQASQKVLEEIAISTKPNKNQLLKLTWLNRFKIYTQQSANKRPNNAPLSATTAIIVSNRVKIKTDKLETVAIKKIGIKSSTEWLSNFPLWTDRPSMK